MKSIGDQRAPFERVVEQLALRERHVGLGAQLPQPLAVFQRDGVLEEEQVVRFELACEANRVDRLEALVHVVA
jgi:hypothetical protein